MKTYIILATLGVALLGGLFYWFLTSQNVVAPTEQSTQDSETKPVKSENTPANISDQNQHTFENPKKSAHYETNTPVHGATLAGVPINVVIDFNFDLAKPSEIKILKDNQDFGTGETAIDSNKLAMRRAVKPDAPDGLYRVEYKACWPDTSCHEGYFQFAIDRSKAPAYIDQTGKKEVTIRLTQSKFDPDYLKISKGTKITWVNDDNVEHYVNTDSHPAHTYYPVQNSKVLKKGESFSLTFDQAGVYPYHCSAHAASMIGSLLVE